MKARLLFWLGDVFYWLSNLAIRACIRLHDAAMEMPSGNEPPCCECGGNHICDDCPTFVQRIGGA